MAKTIWQRLAEAPGAREALAATDPAAARRLARCVGGVDGPGCDRTHERRGNKVRAIKLNSQGLCQACQDAAGETD